MTFLSLINWFTLSLNTAPVCQQLRAPANAVRAAPRVWAMLGVMSCLVNMSHRDPTHSWIKASLYLPAWNLASAVTLSLYRWMSWPLRWGAYLLSTARTFSTLRWQLGCCSTTTWGGNSVWYAFGWWMVLHPVVQASMMTSTGTLLSCWIKYMPVVHGKYTWNQCKFLTQLHIAHTVYMLDLCKNLMKSILLWNNPSHNIYKLWRLMYTIVNGQFQYYVTNVSLFCK